MVISMRSSALAARSMMLTTFPATEPAAVSDIKVASMRNPRLAVTPRNPEI